MQIKAGDLLRYSPEKLVDRMTRSRRESEVFSQKQGLLVATGEVFRREDAPCRGIEFVYVLTGVRDWELEYLLEKVETDDAD